MADCIFCKIASKQMKSDLVYDRDDVVAFRDIDPKAPKHFLVVPRKHVASVADLADGDTALVGRLLLAAKEVAAAQGLSSFRLVVNTGPDAGQTVPHLHVHVLGGRVLGWPPG